MKVLFLSLCLLALATKGAAQEPHEWPEFTVEEFFRALRRIMPDADAQRLASELAPDKRPSVGELGIPPNLAPAEGSQVYGVSFVSDDVLILLALESDQLRRKVVAYRIASNGGRPLTPEQQQKWDARYAQFLKWKEAGYPLDTPVEKPDRSGDHP